MKKKSILLLEIFIWIVILGALVSYGFNSLTKQGFSNAEYQVEFNDIDNLAVGSPIRIMGIQTGHVTKITPKQDKVVVAFSVADEHLVIPDGSSLNIQFTGMAGSKSIEIQPPVHADNSNVALIVREPIRINSLIELQANMSKSILDFSSNFLGFFGNGGVEAMQHNIKLANETSNRALSKAGSTNKALTNINRVIVNNSEPVERSLAKHNDSTDKINFYSKKILNNQDNRKIIKSFASGSMIFANSTEFQNNITPTYNYLNDANKFFKCLNTKTNTVICKGDSVSNTFSKIDDFLNNFENTLTVIDNNIKPAKIDEFNKKMKTLKNSTKDLEKSID